MKVITAIIAWGINKVIKGITVTALIAQRIQKCNILNSIVAKILAKILANAGLYLSVGDSPTGPQTIPYRCRGFPNVVQRNYFHH